MEIWEDSPCDSRESNDTPDSMCRQGYRLLNRGPIAEYPCWRTLAEQDHWLYDTAYQRVRRIAGRWRLPGLGARRGAVRRDRYTGWSLGTPYIPRLAETPWSSRHHRDTEPGP